MPRAYARVLNVDVCCGSASARDRLLVLRAGAAVFTVEHNDNPLRHRQLLAGLFVSLSSLEFFSVVRQGTVRYSNVQHGTARYIKLHQGTARYSTVQHGTARYRKLAVFDFECAESLMSQTQLTPNSY